MKTENKSFLTSSLIITGLSVLGYLSAFSFQYGYFSYFSIPIYFIEINITTIVIAAVTVFIIFAAYAGILDLISKFGFFKKKTEFNKRIRIIIVLGIFVLIFLDLYKFRNLVATLIFIGYYLIIVFILIGIPILKNRDKKTLEERFVFDKESNVSSEDDSFLQKLIQRDFKVTVAITMGLLVILAAYISGNSQAFGQKNFLVPEGANYILIQKYDSHIIGVGYNPETKKITNSIYLIENNKVEKLIWQELGPLTLVKNFAR